jgi:hypothetical protein
VRSRRIAVALPDDPRTRRAVMTRALQILVDHLTAAIVARIERLKAWIVDRNAKAIHAHTRHASGQSTKRNPL